MMKTSHVLVGTLSWVPPHVLALSGVRWRLLALGAGGGLMVGLTALGLWLIRLALKTR
ncbi:hypothetical protein JRI60_18625 [Archangium violaceum]|uniref:hypothetical protein n=1 Tax=Archangium violaceum TaxID=83451 RepID=UPI001950D0C2|nr:hypothetical protein [Archangium violaceum]QRO00898.1 hypothetical protein JRI60_18625 [Archangium violaceum]